MKLKNLVRIALLNDPRFHSKSDKYLIYINYLFIDNKNVNVELIWSLSENDYHDNKKDTFFYDTFKIFLHG